PPFPSRTDHAPDYTTFLTDEEAERLARITGTDVDLLHAMTLRRYDGYALALHDSRRVVRRVRLWGRGIGSRYCPQCLTEGDGRWALRWRLTWSIACTRHQVLLAHACPACGQWPHRRRFFTHDVAQHECSARKPGTRTICRADLTQSPVISLTSDNPVLSAQKWINGLLDQIEADVRDPGLRHAFTNLTAIATHSLLRAEPGDFSDCGPEIEHARQHHGNSALYAPIDAAVMAGPLTRAVQVTRDPLDDASFTAIRVLTDRGAALQKKGNIEQLRRDTARIASAALEQQFWRAIDPHLATEPRLRYRTCTTHPSKPVPGDSKVTERPRSLPHLLWLNWALLLLPPAILTNSDDYRLWRAALAAVVLLPGWWQDGNKPVVASLHGHHPLRLGGHLPKIAQGGTDVLTAICLLAEYLDDHGAPIDYTRRRTLNGVGLLPETAWNDIRRRTGTDPGDCFRLPAVRRFLYRRMTGSHLYSPSQSLRLDLSPGSRVLPAILTEPLLAALDEHAADHLAAHDISEPVSWSPPLALVDHLDLPGRSMSLPDTDQAARLIRTHQMSLAATAQAMGTSPEHLRLAFEIRSTRLELPSGPT
ncbi:TniQ family protein, partial [Nonomuraea sp. NPDC026600]|uniref:TniQ family protein n=1 Tax=Nonomuraea sp. NPDC026600 TaxID=3155363 RepID=UPI0034063B38